MRERSDTWRVGSVTYHIKLLKEVRVKTYGQIVILPVGRCLEIVGDGHESWCVLIDEGEGHMGFRKDDPHVVEATMDDLVNEPEYNGYETLEPP